MLDKILIVLFYIPLFFLTLGIYALVDIITATVVFVLTIVLFNLDIKYAYLFVILVLFVASFDNFFDDNNLSGGYKIWKSYFLRFQSFLQ